MNASLHWDAEASVTYGPTDKTRPEFDNARAHLYDVLQYVGSDDPAKIFNYYWSEKGLKFHTDGLTTCRLYYSYISDYLGHQAIEFGRRHFHSPVSVIVCYQSSALLTVAVSMALLLTRCLLRLPPGRHYWPRVGICVLCFLSLCGCPVMLSLARQMLTETAGLGFLIPTLLLTAWAVSPRRASLTATVAAAVAGLCCFFTVRSRYTLGPAVAMLMPVVVLQSKSRLANTTIRWLTLTGTFAVCFFVPAVIDYRRFGPMLLPGVYDEVMVRSGRLFFHADPPYTDYINAVFINLAMLVVPAVGIWCWLDRASRAPSVSRAKQAMLKGVVCVVVIVLAVLLWRTAAQQIKFQSRHLFAVSGTAVVLFLLLLPDVRWRRVPAVGFSAMLLFFGVWNGCSTFGPQRLHAVQYQPDFVTVVSRHLGGTEGATATRSLARDVWPSYFDWADTRLLHDTLTCWNFFDAQTDAQNIARNNSQRSAQRNPLVLIDDAADRHDQFRIYATNYLAFEWSRTSGRVDAATIDLVREALSHDRPVYLLTAPGRRPPEGVMKVELLPLNLMSTSVCRITRVAPAAVYLDSGVTSQAAADGLTLQKLRGTAGHFDPIFGYLPRVQQEHLTYDSDPTAVVYEVSGLRPGGQYELGFVTWNADAIPRKMRLVLDTPDAASRKMLLSSEPIAARSVAGVAPGEIRVLLTRTNSTTARFRFENVSATGNVVVSEIWCREVEN